MNNENQKVLFRLADIGVLCSKCGEKMQIANMITKSNNKFKVFYECTRCDNITVIELAGTECII